MKKYILTLLGIFLFGMSFAQVNFVPFADNLNSPVDLQHAGDDRLFVVEQGGLIKILDLNGNVNPTAFLDISGQVSGGSEQGLLGLAFHPDYANNGFFYVNYTKTNGDTRIARFSVDPGDPDIALLGSELTILEYSQPFSNHNGGGIAFGPDGYLYISSGDGGSGGDPGNRAQNTTILLGKLLRIDVDNPSGGNNYGIPADNPFAGSSVNAQEIWAYGLRNPWRFSFDSLTGDLWIGDVGQGDVEEIDKAGPTEAGLNYGWRGYEGSEPFNTSNCPDPSMLTFPVAEYSSSTGSGNCSVTGGYVYRGNTYNGSYGLYLAADVCSGRVFTVDSANNLVDEGTFSGAWVSFGVDFTNELYIVDIGGRVLKFEGTILDLDEFDLNSFTVTPNPANAEVRIASEKDTIASIVVTDLKGSVLYSEGSVRSLEATLSVENYSKGMYLVRITSEAGAVSVQKLAVQ